MSVFETRGIAPKVVEALQRDEELFKVAESILERASLNTNTFKNLVRDLREIRLRAAMLKSLKRPVRSLF